MKLIAFNNGNCIADKKMINQHEQKKTIKFPATFFYLDLLGIKILFDTGYSVDMIKSKNVFLKLYIKLMKMKCHSNADEVLKNNNINPNEITHIIISHFHPDHYGSLKQFNNAQIICSENAYKLLSEKKLSKIKNLIFDAFIPQNISQRVLKLENYPKSFLYTESHEVIILYDILNLHKIYGCLLEGHTQGHIGIYIKDLAQFIIFDAVWCKENLSGARAKKIVEKIVFFNKQSYENSIKKINEIVAIIEKTENKKIEIIISHDEKYMRSPYEF